MSTSQNNRRANASILIGEVFVIALIAASLFAAYTGMKLMLAQPAVGALAAIAWPCPLPASVGTRSVATLEKRGDRYDITCRDILPFIKPAAAPAKGTR